MTELINSVREWFDSTCQDLCNGHNNLYTPQLTCLDRDTGTVSSKVHHEGDTPAQVLIDLATADVQKRQPPVVHLSHGWILHLNPETLPDQMQSSSGNKSQPLSADNKPQSIIIGISLGAAMAAVILLLSVVGIIFAVRNRCVSKLLIIILSSHFSIAESKISNISFHMWLIQTSENGFWSY